MNPDTASAPRGRTAPDFRPTLPALPARVAAAAVISLLLHTLFVSGAMRGLADVFHWKSNAEPAPVVVNARIAALPPPAALPVPPPAPRAVPRKPARKVAPGGTPGIRLPQAEIPPIEAAPTDVAAAGTAPSAATAPPAPAAAPEAAAPVDTPVTPKPTEPVREAAPQRRAPLPEFAAIDLELTLESNNYKVWATQVWRIENGRYHIVLDAAAKALFFTIGSMRLEASGAITGDGLRAEHYVDERNRRRTAVDFVSADRAAVILESSGNRKTVPVAGRALDIMSLTFDLAFNPDLNIGAPMTLSNRDSLEEVRLVGRREEILQGDAGPVLTRYYDFRRPNDTGGIEVWLAVERQWLPAKVRIRGRDGAMSMVATRYALNAPDSR